MSTFSGLNTALSALYAQRRALDITGQNIANVNTEGYSRQRVELTPVENVSEPARYATSNGVGDGVRIAGVTRLHNEFSSSRTRAEHGLNEYLQAQRTVYANIEQVLGEPSDTGLQAQLSEYWSAWSDVANRPGDTSARTQLLARANTVAGTIRTDRSNLGELYTATREQLSADIDVVNQTTGGIADLNSRIAMAKVADMPTNELSDKRDQLILRLSELTGATSRPKLDGSTDVLLAGAVIVQGDIVRKVTAVGSTTVDGRAASPPQVQFEGGAVASITSGRIASRLETLNKTVPDAVKDLDDITGLLISNVNTQHAKGWDITVVPPATTPTPLPGGDFFSGTDARDIGVAITNPMKIAASSTGTNPYQGDNATLLANFAKDPKGVDVEYRNYVVDIGIAAQTINRRADAQQVISDDVTSAEQAESGVSLDEEMTNMLQFQRAYEAAAKVIQVIDSTLDSLINMKR